MAKDKEKPAIEIIIVQQGEAKTTGQLTPKGDSAMRALASKLFEDGKAPSYIVFDGDTPAIRNSAAALRQTFSTLAQRPKVHDLEGEPLSTAFNGGKVKKGPILVICGRDEIENLSTSPVPKEFDCATTSLVTDPKTGQKSASGHLSFI